MQKEWHHNRAFADYAGGAGGREQGLRIRLGQRGDGVAGADLAAALEAPWERWAVWLHPAQKEFVDRDFNGPARVIGSAGTGKTVVALHRAG